MPVVIVVVYKTKGKGAVKGIEEFGLVVKNKHRHRGERSIIGSNTNNTIGAVILHPGKQDIIRHAVRGICIFQYGSVEGWHGFVSINQSIGRASVKPAAVSIGTMDASSGANMHPAKIVKYDAVV